MGEGGLSFLLESLESAQDGAHILAK